jgi:hypothetical protein
VRARTTATVVLAGAVMVLTAGCNFISPQATTQHYDASDGFSTNVGSVELRNAMVFTKNGDEASLSVTLLNTSSTARTVKFQYSSFGSDTTVTIPVKAHGETRRGTTGGDEQTILTGIGKQPGTLLQVYVQYGSSSGKTFKIPVLDASLKEYATLLPSPVPTSTVQPGVIPTRSATPAP